jgi:rod shape-determining protein MreB
MTTVHPIGRGVVSAPLAAGELLKELFPRALGWRGKLKPAVVAAVPARITEAQETAFRRALQFAGINQVTLVAKPVAAALGAVDGTGRQQATTVVDIGAETTEVAALSPGIVVCEAMPLGGRHFDDAIRCHLRNHHGLEIDLSDAESLKKSLCSAHPNGDSARADVFGRELDSGLPHTVNVQGAELRQAIAPCLESLVALIKRTLDQTPAGLSQDILTHGLVLTGGGALLIDLDLFLSERTGLKVRVADNPGDCAVLGLLKTMDSFAEPSKEEN